MAAPHKALSGRVNICVDLRQSAGNSRSTSRCFVPVGSCGYAIRGFRLAFAMNRMNGTNARVTVAAKKLRMLKIMAITRSSPPLRTARVYYLVFLASIRVMQRGRRGAVSGRGAVVWRWNVSRFLLRCGGRGRAGHQALEMAVEEPDHVQAGAAQVGLAPAVTLAR